MKTISKIAALAALLSSASLANAINFDLLSSTATVFPGNTTSSFYEITGAGVESGTAASLYVGTVGGSSTNGYWVKIDFDGNPQPVLTSAFLKAGSGASGGGYLYWDSVDLASFNAGTYDSITLWNQGANGLKNPPGNAYLGTSHAGLNGTPGTDDGGNVPDGGLTVTMLGFALGGLATIARQLKK